MRLNQVTLPSRNVAAGRDFYRRLGFILIVDSTPRYVRLEAPEGGATLSLHHVDAAPDGPRAVIYLETDRLDDEVSRLKAAGIRFRSGPLDEPWLWREARLLDPDGNEICLFHAGESRLNPPWRVSA
ncbi:MAG: VOC family protein [Hyphomonadaceae bacterium]